MTPRLDASTVRRTLRDAGLRARHGLSQNFLTDIDVLETILALADPAPGRRVLEIGPGLGVLTGALLDAGAAVTAVELDRGLAAHLRQRLSPAIERAGSDGAESPGALRLIEGDALDHDLTALVPPPYDVVANLPYHITSPILHALLGRPPRAAKAVLMVQREVAEPGAGPGVADQEADRGREHLVGRVDHDLVAAGPRRRHRQRRPSARSLTGSSASRHRCATSSRASTR